MYSQSNVEAVKQHGSQQASAQPPTWSQRRADLRRPPANRAEICFVNRSHLSGYLFIYLCLVYYFMSSFYSFVYMLAPNGQV